MKNQKLIIISVVITILLLAVIGISVLLNNQIKAANCIHSSWEMLTDETYHWNQCTSCDEVLFEKEVHRYVDGVCVTCEYICQHPTYINGYCVNCGIAGQGCEHPSWKFAYNESEHWSICTICEELVFEKEAHQYVNGVCVICEYPCMHPGYVNGYCVECSYPCDHLKYENGICINCGMPGHCSHSEWELTWDENYHWNQCKSCKTELFGKEVHKYVKGVCVTCKYACKHPTYTNGSCTQCGTVKQECLHPTWILIWDENYHWNQCTSCAKELFGKEAHTFINGKCVTCNYICNHSDIIWQNDEIEHWQVCKKCSGEVIGTRTKHNYTNGVCTVCSLKCEHKSLEWKMSDTEHWLICKTCSGEVVNTRGTHIITEWKDQGDGTHTGTCSVCSIKIIENHTYNNGKCDCGFIKECTHENKEWKLSETEHWLICTSCNKEIEGTRGTHIYKNGACTTCASNCKHTNKTWKRDENAHWQECRICLCEIAGTRSTHNITVWESLDSQTHTGTCTVCNIIIKENHTYENEKCKCGATQKVESVDCKHEDTKWLAISTEHWKVCKDCEQEISGTKGNHTFENGRCKECNYVCKHEKIEWKNNETEHWQVCKNCLGEVEGTRELHTFEENKCTKCSIIKVGDNNKPGDNDNNNPSDNDNNKPGDNDNNNNLSNNDNSSDKENNNEDDKDTTQKGDKIPNTGIEDESMKIAIMITAAVIGCAVLINLSRKED